MKIKTLINRFYLLNVLALIISIVVVVLGVNPLILKDIWTLTMGAGVYVFFKVIGSGCKRLV